MNLLEIFVHFLYYHQPHQLGVFAFRSPWPVGLMETGPVAPAGWRKLVVDIEAGNTREAMQQVLKNSRLTFWPLA
jgi:hypothetical protein